jgi:hypothetical protein
MSAGNRVHNIFINSANRNIQDSAYDFTIYFDNDEINVLPNEAVNINVVSFSLLNSMYNVNQYTNNNTFILQKNNTINTTITIPYGNYSVYTLRDQLNSLMSGLINVVYNPATNTYTYTNLTVDTYKLNPLNCKKLLGLSALTTITTQGITSTYINMVDYQQVILRCPTLTFETSSMDNIQDHSNFIAISDILYWVNKQDVEPFKMINYRNEDCSTAYSYNVLNRSFTYLNFKLVNEYNNPIYDAPDFLLQLQVSIFDKTDDEYFKTTTNRILNLLNDIYYTILSIVSFISLFNLKIKKS